MVPRYVSPATGEPLALTDDHWQSPSGERFAVVAGVPRFCEVENYTASFGEQWNHFRTTQIDGEGTAVAASEMRLFAETGWQKGGLDGLDLLEVGSGAGRFTRTLIDHTQARISSVDYSTAVEANLANNGGIAPDRLRILQASIYDLPFANGSFDKVLCLGVLQHTPDFEKSVAALVAQAKPGGEIVVDFYPVKGWWTWLNAKYLLRPLTKRMKRDRLMGLIERHADRLIAASQWLDRRKLGILRRFLPVVDMTDTFPAGLTEAERREWVVLDTFDMFSPEHDHPQRVATVARMVERAGAKVTFAGFIANGSGSAAVVRGIRKGA